MFAIHLQCRLREWAWSTRRPLPNTLKLHCMAQQCVSYFQHFLQCLTLFNIFFFCLVCPSLEKKMVETSRIRVAVLESKYASLEDHGVPLSVYLQLQQLGLQLNQAQWTARHSLGGFFISFFWPALDLGNKRR